MCIRDRSCSTFARKRAIFGVGAVSQGVKPRSSSTFARKRAIFGVGAVSQEVKPRFSSKLARKRAICSVGAVSEGVKLRSLNIFGRKLTGEPVWSVESRSPCLVGRSWWLDLGTFDGLMSPA